MEPQTVLRIAKKAEVSKDTVRRVLAGERVRPSKKALVLQALVALNWAHLAPPTARTDYEKIRDLARQASVDPDTVRRVLAGAPTRPSTRGRVLAAAATLKLEDLLPRPAAHQAA